MTQKMSDSNVKSSINLASPYLSSLRTASYHLRCGKKGPLRNALSKVIAVLSGAPLRAGYISAAA